MKSPEKIGVDDILQWIEQAQGESVFATLEDRKSRIETVSEGIAAAYDRQRVEAESNAKRARRVIELTPEVLPEEFDVGYIEYTQLARETGILQNRSPVSRIQLRAKTWNGIIRHFQSIEGQKVVWYPKNIPLDIASGQVFPESRCRVSSGELARYLSDGGAIGGFGKISEAFMNDLLFVLAVRSLPEVSLETV